MVMVMMVVAQGRIGQATLEFNLDFDSFGGTMR